MIAISGPVRGQAAVCEPILRRRPQWFGIESALQDYAHAIDDLPTLLARDADTVAGFLTIKQHNAFAAEIHVMAVDPLYARRGVGRALIAAIEAHLQRQQIEYLQVKTLGPSRIDPHYAATRAFYEALGFREVEEFATLWDGNPCLLLVKRLEHVRFQLKRIRRCGSSWRIRPA